MTYAASGAPVHEDHVDPTENLSVLEVYDPQFQYLYEVPTTAVTHLPPARLNITRLVLCRSYVPHRPESCPMGDHCKFVHADCDERTLTARPIHVNYVWRHESRCTYPRLPPGETVVVRLPNGKGPAVLVPSERLLETEGALCRDRVPLEECVAFNYQRQCRNGVQCQQAHIIVVDPNAKRDFLRAPARPLPVEKAKERDTPQDNEPSLTFHVSQLVSFRESGCRSSLPYHSPHTNELSFASDAASLPLSRQSSHHYQHLPPSQLSPEANFSFSPLTVPLGETPSSLYRPVMPSFAPYMTPQEESISASTAATSPSTNPTAFTTSLNPRDSHRPRAVPSGVAPHYIRDGSPSMAPAAASNRSNTVSFNQHHASPAPTPSTSALLHDGIVPDRTNSPREDRRNKDSDSRSTQIHQSCRTLSSSSSLRWRHNPYDTSLVKMDPMQLC